MGPTFSRIPAADDADLHVKRIHVESQGNFCRLARFTANACTAPTEALQLSDDRTIAWQNIRKSNWPVSSRRRRALPSRARQRERHPCTTTG